MRISRQHNLWRLTRGQRLRYGSAILALGLATAGLLGVPLVTQAAFDGVLAGGGAGHTAGVASGGFSARLAALAAGLAERTGDLGALLLSALVIVGLTVLAGGFQYLRGRWAAQASEGICRRLRDELYGHLERLPSAYHDRAETGDLVQRCTSDVETVRVFLAAQVVELGRSVLLLAGALPLMLLLDARMTLASTLLFPVIFLFAIAFFRRVKRLFLAMDEAEGRMTTVLQENLTGIRVVRAFARQSFEIEKFGRENGTYRDRFERLLRFLSLYWSFSDLMCFSQLGIALFYGAAALRAGSLSVGELFAFTTLVGMVIWPLRHMGRVLTDSGKAVVSLGRLREILAQPVEADPQAAAPDRPLAGEIEVEHLDFAYGEGEPVLCDVTFRVAPGETLALIGPPGAGKSTLIQLLLRLYDYEHGSIRLDGHELRELDRGFVRSQIATVLQEPFLYSKTLRANIALGREQAGEEEIRGAARDACIDGAIDTFEDRYDTLVGERGVTLSGGQRQRIALARALLREAPILVLDDSLSAVDTKTEAAILDALQARRGRSTTIVISHRLSSVVHAERILVLEEGRIVQSGSHAELVRAEGPYRRLWRIQGSLEEELAADLTAGEMEEARP